MHEVSLVLPYDPLEDRRKDDVTIKNIFLFNHINQIDSRDLD